MSDCSSISVDEVLKNAVGLPAVGVRFSIYYGGGGGLGSDWSEWVDVFVFFNLMRFHSPHTRTSYIPVVHVLVRSSYEEDIRCKTEQKQWGEITKPTALKFRSPKFSEKRLVRVGDETPTFFISLTSKGWKKRSRTVIMHDYKWIKTTGCTLHIARVDVEYENGTSGHQVADYFLLNSMSTTCLTRSLLKEQICRLLKNEREWMLLEDMLG